jgi:hypothetical protein
MSGIIQRKMAQEPDFAQKVRNDQATRPVVPITPEGQQVQSEFVARPFELGRGAHIGQIVVFHHRKGEHIGGQLFHPAMVMGWTRDGLADLLVFTGAREGDWVQRYASQRSVEEKWGTWEFAEPPSESPFKLLEAIAAPEHRVRVLEARFEAADLMDKARQEAATELAQVGAPRPPGSKRH